MWHDDFGSERYRVQRVMEILEHAARRLEARAYVPLTVLKDAVAFIDASEAVAHEAADAHDDHPACALCLQRHSAVDRPLTAMKEATAALESGDASAASRLARFARAYVELRRQHLRSDRGLFARQSSADTGRLFLRLADATALFDIR